MRVAAAADAVQINDPRKERRERRRNRRHEKIAGEKSEGN
jgi:hypothetical protein